jgi:hypothetical protein
MNNIKLGFWSYQKNEWKLFDDDKDGPQNVGSIQTSGMLIAWEDFIKFSCQKSSRTEWKLYFYCHFLRKIVSIN